MSNDTTAPEPQTPEEELDLLVPTEFPEDEFPDPSQEPEDLGKEDS